MLRFYYCRIWVTDFREWGLLAPLPPIVKKSWKSLSWIGLTETFLGGLMEWCSYFSCRADGMVFLFFLEGWWNGVIIFPWRAIEWCYHFPWRADGMVLFFTQKVKARTCYTTILYRLCFRIFSIISFDLHTSLAIVAVIIFISSFCLLKRFFQF